MGHRFVASRTRTLAKGQRRKPTTAEAMLWRALRGRRFADVMFRRQVPLGPYVADFVCLPARLIVELDGPVHDDPAQKAHDAKRDAWLQAQGLRILRFANDLFLAGSGELALGEIAAALAGRLEDPSSDPRRRAGHLLPHGEKEALNRA